MELVKFKKNENNNNNFLKFNIKTKTACHVFQYTLMRSEKYLYVDQLFLQFMRWNFTDSCNLHGMNSTNEILLVIDVGKPYKFHRPVVKFEVQSSSMDRMVWRMRNIFPRFRYFSTIVSQ